MNISFYSILPWVLPPVAGAAIGYITNAIAIRMLFRPFTEKRFLGIHVPFTPGIIPKQRDNLAGSIADMVSQQLLTEDAVRKQISSEKFQKGISDNVAAFTEDLLNKKIGELMPENREHGAPITGELRPLIRDLSGGFVRSEGFKRITRRFIEIGVDYLFRLKISDVVSKFDNSRKLIYGMTGLLSSEKTKKQILGWIDQRILTNVGGSDTIGSFLPREAEVMAGTAFNHIYPSLYEAVIAWLNKEDVRRELEKRGKVLLKDIIARLRPLQKFFVSAAGYDLTLDRKMPEIIDDLVKRVEEAGASTDFQNRIREGISDSIARIRNKSFEDFHYESRRRFTYTLHIIVKIVLERFSSEQTRQKLTDWIWNNITGDGSRTIGEMLEEHFKVDAEKTVDYLCDRLSGWLSKSSNAGGRYVLDNINGLLKNYEERRVRDFFGIDQQVKRKCDHYITNKINTLIEKRVPHIVRGFDVHSLVVDKINSLDIENVENLLLMVIEKHLKWINIFGAILGAFIGALQVILNRVV